MFALCGGCSGGLPMEKVAFSRVAMLGCFFGVVCAFADSAGLPLTGRVGRHYGKTSAKTMPEKTPDECKNAKKKLDRVGRSPEQPPQSAH